MTGRPIDCEELTTVKQFILERTKRTAYTVRGRDIQAVDLGWVGREVHCRWWSRPTDLSGDWHLVDRKSLFLSRDEAEAAIAGTTLAMSPPPKDC